MLSAIQWKFTTKRKRTATKAFINLSYKTCDEFYETALLERRYYSFIIRVNVNYAM